MGCGLPIRPADCLRRAAYRQPDWQELGMRAFVEPGRASTSNGRAKREKRCDVESGQEGMFVLCSCHRLSVPPSLERQKPCHVIPAVAKRRAGIHEHHGPGKKRATGDLRHDQSSCSWIPGSPCGSPSTNARVCTGNDEALPSCQLPQSWRLWASSLRPRGCRAQPGWLLSGRWCRAWASTKMVLAERTHSQNVTHGNADPPDSRLPACGRKVAERSQDGCYPAGAGGREHRQKWF